MATKKKAKAVIPSEARLMRDILTPDGFEREVSRDEQWNNNLLTFTNGEITITIRFFSGEGRRESIFLASGHVEFKVPGGGVRTYDRYGVEDSFYIDNPAQWPEWREDGPPDVIVKTNETIRHFIEERIPESLARIARSEQVPTLPFSVTPEQKQGITSQLLSGVSYSFMPSGFGTGYTLHAQRLYMAERSPALQKFFDVPCVYVSTFDAD